MSFSRRVVQVLGAIALCALLPAQEVLAQFEKVRIETVPVAPGLHMLVGQGGNIGVFIGSDGVLMIDDQFAPLGEKIRSAVAKLSNAPIRFLLNTHWHGDHSGGNQWVGKAGGVIVAHDAVRARMSTRQVMAAFGQSVPPSPPEALPLLTYGRDITFHINGDTVHVRHVAAAHTDGDSIVHFERANAIHAGDTFFNNGFPFIDLSSGGSIDGLIAAADQLLAIANDRTRIIPGHGPLSNRAELAAYRGMLVDVRGRVAKALQAGQSADEVVEAQLLADLAGRFGNGVMEPEGFLRIVHASLASR
jgi:glyoxylase-like metal-dependent hydrolase (beta-lactamase superfamily II)